MLEKFGLDNIGNNIGRALIKTVGLNVDIDNPRSTKGTKADIGPIKDLKDLDRQLSSLSDGSVNGMMSAYSTFLKTETDRRRLY